MKRFYSEMILKSMMSNNNEHIVNNILDWMETINDEKSNNFMDIITGASTRNKHVLECIKSDNDRLVKAAKEYMKKYYKNRNVISLSITSEPFYDNDFSVIPVFIISAVYEYDNGSKKKISKEDAARFEDMKRDFAMDFNGKNVVDDTSEYESRRNKLYNFVGGCKEYSGEDAVEVVKIDYNTYTVTL